MPSAEYMREYRKSRPEFRDRERAADRARKYSAYHAEGKPLKPFAGVDGESCISNGQPRYTLLRAGEHVLMNDVGLSHKDVLPWLTQLPADVAYVGFVFDYDVTMILRTAPWRKLVELVRSGSCFIGCYRITYRARSFFSVQQFAVDNGIWSKDPTARRFYVSDTIKLFQSAFVKVMDDWEALTPQLRDLVKQGKDKRAFVEHLDEEVIEYNRLECVALAEVMEKVRQAAHELDIRPTRWESPGQLAASLMANHDTPRRKEYEDRWPKQVLDAGRAAYYGGRFEPSRFGRVRERVTEIDLGSAYPDALTRLPCVRHAKWVHCGSDPAQSGVGGVLAEPCRPRLLRIRTAPAAGADGNVIYWGLPFRDKDGGVWFPHTVEGWYWDFEVAQALHQDVTVLESWEWRTDCECEQPFAWIPGLFEARKRMGKSAKGKVLKLAMNSLYGKFAQTVGSPVYANHVVASFITAQCRARVMAAIHAHGCGLAGGEGTCGGNCVMVATDAVFVTGDVQVPLTDGLGGWEAKPYPEGIFVVQAGVYWSESDAYTKTRGTPLKLIMEKRDEFERAYRDMVASGDLRRGDVYVPCQRFVGLRDAVHRGNAVRLGSFVWLGAENERPGKRIGFDWSGKRRPEPVEASDSLITLPRDPHFDPRSRAYPKVVPGLERDAELGKLDDSPEWLGQLGLF